MPTILLPNLVVEILGNAGIHDLKLAPRNERGRVECWTDFFLLKPVDSRRGNRRILYDVSNRGNKLAIEAFNGTRSNDPTTLADAGNGFLMRRGYSILWCGWNGNVMADGKKRLLVGLPIAREDGRPITGEAHVEICTSEKVYSRPFFWSPWGTSDAYPAVSRDNSSATLVMRPKRGEPGVEISRNRWAFARQEDGKPIPDPKHLYVKDGFRPGWLHDLVYIATNPRVTGQGLAALRDCVSFFRYAKQGRRGTAKTDLELSGNVRICLVAGAQHLGGGPHTKGICQQHRNTLDDRPPVFRAMLVALDRWVSAGEEPPPSRYPSIADDTLVDLDTFRRQFPEIPGVRLPQGCYRPARLDFGPRFHTQGIADVVPPKTGPSYRTLVPAVDANGNEVAGIRLPDVAVPLGTYTGWNLRAAEYGAEEMLAGLHGVYLPFARTPEERRECGYPRLSVLERYSTREVYLARMTDAALELNQQSFLLAEDVVAILKAASQHRLWNRP